MKLSIIIPTYNEEKYLPKLLNSIKEQDFKDYEIIIADNNSKDKTRKISKKFGCRVIKGGNVNIGRNNGAKIAGGDYLLFADADITLSKNFLMEVITKFENNNLDCADFIIKPIDKSILEKFMFMLSNMYRKIIQYFNPCTGFGGCILIKKDLHNKIKGFNENFKWAGDHSYIIKASKLGKHKLINNIVFHPMRRFEEEGILRVVWISIKNAVRNTFGIQDKDLDYKS